MEITTICHQKVGFSYLTNAHNIYPAVFTIFYCPKR